MAACELNMGVEYLTTLIPNIKYYIAPTLNVAYDVQKDR